MVLTNPSSRPDDAEGRQAAAKKSRVVRVVDQKTAVVPLHADTLADPDKLLASLRSLFALSPSPSGRGPG